MDNNPASADRDAAEQVEIQFGRRAPFSMNPDWVLLAPASRDARLLYWALNAHVNQQRGDTEVWPTQDQLAEILGYANRKDVKVRLDELIAIDAVEVRKVRTHGGMRPRSIYTVHQTPPDGWTGHESMRGFYRSLNQGFSQVTPNDPTRGHSSDPAKGRSNDPARGSSSDPAKGQEQDEPEPDEFEPDEDSLRSSVPRASDHTVSPSRVTAPSPADAEPDERTNGEIDPKRKEVAVVRGLDVTAALGREITDEHRDLAQQLIAERDSEVWDVVARQTSMSMSQRRQLAALLPRAVALVGGDLDRVRGWLYEKGLQATVATYVLNAFDDERIEDVWTSMPMEHVTARAERARQAEIAAQERQERQNAGAESHWGQKARPGRQIATQSRADDPWASAAPRSVASTEGQEEGEPDSGPGEPPAPEPARKLLINAEFDPTVQQVNTVRNAIELHGYEAVDNVVKGAVERGEGQQLAGVLRSFDMSTFARTVADLSR